MNSVVSPMNSPTSSLHQVHPEPTTVSVDHDGRTLSGNEKLGGFLDTTLKMTGYRKKRFGKVPDPVIIPPPVTTLPSPASPAKSDSFLDSASPKTPHSPTKRFVLKPISALTAAFQRTTLNSLTGRRKSASFMKTPKSPRSPKAQKNASPQSPRSPRLLYRKGSSGSPTTAAESPFAVSSNQEASSSQGSLNANHYYHHHHHHHHHHNNIHHHTNNNNNNGVNGVNNNSGNSSATSLNSSPVQKNSFFKSLSINTSQVIAQKPPSKLGKFNIRSHAPHSPHKALPMSPPELGERLRELINDENSKISDIDHNRFRGDANCSKRNSMNLSNKLLHHPLPKPILIDVRNLAVFEDAHVRRSFNVNLPTLLIKRYRRGNVSNFALDNFITTPEGREKYLDIIQEDGGKPAHDVIVFDETMDETDKTSPGWTLLGVLERAMLADSSSENLEDGINSDIKGRVYWLKGGFDAFKKWDSAKELIGSGCDAWVDEIPAVSTTAQYESNDNATDIVESSDRVTTVGLVRRDSLFSVNTEQSSLRRKRSEQQDRQQIVVNGDSSEQQPQQVSLQNQQQQQQPVKTEGQKDESTDSSPKSLIGDVSLRSRRASNGLQYLFGPSRRNSVAVDTLIPPSTPADPNRQFHSQLLPENDTNVDSPDTPTSSPQVTHPETAFVVSTIIPDFLYLGPEITKPQEVEELKQRNIRRILNMAFECDDVMGLSSELDMYLKLNIKDSVEEDVENGLRVAVGFIEQAEKDSAPIYVHCKAGKSRSVTAVLAYLIQSRRWTLKAAYDYVMTRRRGICPNIGFVAELMRVEEQVLGVRRSNAAMGFRECDFETEQQKYQEHADTNNITTTGDAQNVTLSENSLV